MSRERRIAKELIDIQADRDDSGVFATSADGHSLNHLKGTVPGPPDTPYAGGSFTIDIQIPDSYPFKSPTMKFDTKIWHPNVSSQTVRLTWLPESPSRSTILAYSYLVIAIIKSPAELDSPLTPRLLGSHLP